MSTTTAPLPGPALPGPYGTAPAPDAVRPSPATLGLVRSQVQALLLSSPAFHSLHAEQRREVARNLVKIAAYAAELVRDDWYQSRRMGQRPLVRERRVAKGPLVQAQSAADEFQPVTASQVARVTQETLRAIAFPTFVADLIKGTFNAIVQASIQQMEAYGQLLANVGKTVDQFMNDNISDNQARDWLAQTYPEHIQVKDGQLIPRPGADERPQPNWRGDLGLNEDVEIETDAMEESLVPAARRKLAQNRLQTLSTLVLMGMQRIVITSGKIRATMGFHIDATDRAHEEHATDLDFRAALAGSANFALWSAQASMSVSYVRSTRGSSDAELNVDADLTGEVDLKFKTDYFPIERFAGADAVGRIQANTAVPEANTVVAETAETPVGRYVSPRTRRSPRPEPLLPRIGTRLPGVERDPLTPVRPTPVEPRPQRPLPRDQQPAQPGPSPGEGAHQSNGHPATQPPEGGATPNDGTRSEAGISPPGVPARPNSPVSREGQSPQPQDGAPAGTPVRTGEPPRENAMPQTAAFDKGWRP